MNRRAFFRAIFVPGGATLMLLGCASFVQRDSAEQMQRSLIASYRAHLEAVSVGPVIEISRTSSDVEVKLSNERRNELDQMSGMAAYDEAPLELGPDLLGSDEPKIARLSLRRTIELAVANNLDLRVARLAPAIAATQITRAEAVFDAVFFTNADWSKQDMPQPAGFVPGLAGNLQDEQFTLGTGIRKVLSSGAQAAVETRVLRQQREPSIFGVTRFYNADVLVSMTQPILRGFGSDVNRARIVLAENARRSEVQRLQLNLMDLVEQVERTYWDLVSTRHRLLIHQRLLERTIDDRDKLEKRIDFDVTPVQLTEANSFVELRRSDVLRARQGLRVVSDTLKRLINSPDLPLAGETVMLPVEQPVDEPLTFSLPDAVTTALDQRPEMQTALFQIKDAGIRQRVADNNRLPQLNLTATTAFSGLGINAAGDAYNDLGGFNFIDYILGAQLEIPIGNRDSHALLRQRRLERQSSVLAYQRQAQDIVREIKNALREVHTSYELIGSTRAARRAAADHLRAIEAQQDAGMALTPEFLDLKLRAQSRVADAEIQELDALTGYNNAVTALHRAMGTLLERNGINFSDHGPR